MKNESLVLVANSSQARLFAFEKMKTLHEIQAFVHSASRLHEQDLIDNKPGRSFDSTGTRRHAWEPHSTQKEHEFEEFAKKIANYLEEARQTVGFNRLYIAAGPTFLGILRKSLPAQILDLVHKEISKDLVHARTEQIVEEFLE